MRSGPVYPLTALKEAPVLVNYKKGAPLNDVSSLVFEDTLVTNFLRTRTGVPDHQFGIVQPTKTSITESLLKSDKRELCPFDDKLFHKAQKYARKMFRHLENTSVLTPLQNVKVDPETSAGFPFSCSKEEVIRNQYDYLSWYTIPGNRDRPIPIWSVTAKIEYLPMEDIKNHKIRLFRNPPLDYLCLEKMYFQDQEHRLMGTVKDTWCALGFVKENGGWHEMVTDLMTRHHQPGVPRWYFKMDVGKFDKSVGPDLAEAAFNLRRRWFKIPHVDYLTWRETIDVRFDSEIAQMSPLVTPIRSTRMEDEIHWKYLFAAQMEQDLHFLQEESGHSYEILPNGSVIATALAAKSGRLLTASDNSLEHIIVWCFHYHRMCRKLGIKPSFAHMIETLINYIYSDDIQGATDKPEFVQFEDLRDTFALFGFEVKEYDLSTDPYRIHFLGASNGKYLKWWVPVYNEERMYFSLAFIPGKISDRERTQRISGLAHNLAFSEKYADTIVELSKHLHSLGRWVDAPLLDKGHLMVAYTPTGLTRQNE